MCEIDDPKVGQSEGAVKWCPHISPDVVGKEVEVETYPKVVVPWL